ncbi:uncharacterized protein LOC123551796 isoform X2 [Mercenaria mercenaria]|uniref:uncharacterized protein LOC123551796 isoform X2 n=1 Tax=Mercenaria mercenaria TaxID=6596 RepID=UPI00234F645B|nr:uncharacterized protein LOC123551796 isoform X2 [Mercenaria mercenaria]
MSSQVCKSRSCIHSAKALNGKPSVRPMLEKIQFRCYSNPSSNPNNCIRMSSRGAGMQKGSGFESKGLILLLICGFYAVLLFIVARLFSYAASKITTPVKSVMWRVDTTEACTKELTDDNNNSGPVMKFKRQQPRTFSHG